MSKHRDYDQFIASKSPVIPPAGFEPWELNKHLMPWQAFVLDWAIRQGRCALFENCGLGKSLQQLDWAHQVCIHTGGNVLILAPLAVAAQTVMEGKKFGIEVNYAQNQPQVRDGINITNYDRLADFDSSGFQGVVLDESSILKSFTGKTKNALIEAFSKTPYRLCCTATPAPNDYMEIGNHAEFLGICTTPQMLATWFINDTFDTGDWRLKKHSEQQFWDWTASWAACVDTPSDIGFSDDGYILPPLNFETITVAVDQTEGAQDGFLFRDPQVSATSIHAEMRLTCDDRVKALADRVAQSPDEQWIIWCNTNQEAEALKGAIPGATEIRGSDKREQKERAAMEFAGGKIRVLISKPSIFGFGMNFQNCHNTAFVGLSYSYEDFYQALRRVWRFGQTKPVNAIIVQAETEGNIAKTIQRKITQHDNMKEKMRKATKKFAAKETAQIANKEIRTHEGEGWTLHHGDCVRVLREKIADESVGFSAFSPPFADLFVYSDDQQDMGNCGGLDEFMVQFGFLIRELTRVIMPGRECAVHCCDLLATKWKDGAIEFKDFSGVIVKAFRDAGWHFHSRICIWKSPVTEMQRTKAHGLLYKTLQKDSAKCRVGSADYLLVFRKPGDNPQPITHTPENFPLSLWQEIASPVWMTIDQSNVLNGKEARDQRDERHICPLQLDVIERALLMWSNPGDLVLSPFTGVGSEGYQSLKMGRRFVGAELKESYVKQAVKFLKQATQENSDTLFK